MSANTRPPRRPRFTRLLPGGRILLVTFSVALFISFLSAPLPVFSQSAEQPIPSFREVAKKVSPSVVNIKSVQVVEMPRRSFYYGPPDGPPHGGEDPFEDFFERFFGTPRRTPAPPEDYKRLGQGSGVIIDKDGYILTASHVVAGAQTLEIKLPDGRKLKGTVKGLDEATDIAVVKIDAPDLHPATIGDSDKIEVGDWVLAIGNPFGLEYTVTQGIISAKGRSNIRLAGYEDFIQTTAAINPGNSGGPLVNLQGEVIGINSMIITAGYRGFIGIGLAIPSNMASSVMEKLIEEGKVVRGYLGFAGETLTPELAQTFDLGDLDITEGVVVSQVLPDTPAEKAGLQPDDIIVEYDGQKIDGWNNLRFRVAETPVNKKVTVKVIRNGKQLALKTTVAERTPEALAAAKPAEKKLGLKVDDLTPEVASQLGYVGLEGAIVAQLDAGSPADLAGLRQGDLILNLGRQVIRNAGDFKAAIAKTELSQPIRLRVRRGEVTRYVVITP